MMRGSGTIIIWSGPIATIPQGWFLCDGNNGTPNLLKRMIIGAGNSFDPGDMGGAVFHQHDFTTNGHLHDIPAGTEVQSFSPIEPNTTSRFDTGTTDNTNANPPFFTLAFIMLGF